MKDVPGIAAVHAIVSDKCRTERGEHGTVVEALRRVRSEYDQLIDVHPVGRQVKFHIVLTVEMPQPAAA